jgi:hypothetical protein
MSSRSESPKDGSLNTASNRAQAVRQKGIDHLSDSEKQHVPPQIDVDNADHLAFFQASFDDDDSMHGHMPESPGAMTASASPSNAKNSSREPCDSKSVM